MKLHEYGTVQFVVKWMIESKAGNDLDVSDVYLIEKIVDACHGDLRRHCMSKGAAIQQANQPDSYTTDFLEYCEIMKLKPTVRDQIIFMAGMTFQSLKQQRRKE